VGLNLDEQPWDASTFSQNRRRRFDEAGIFQNHIIREGGWTADQRLKSAPAL
jgi:hypothetical protein